MAILRAMDGKFYDLPDEEAHKYEVPREKVKDLLAKAGGQPQGGPAPAPGGGGGRPGPHGGPTPPVVINVYAAGGPPGGAPGGAPGGGGAPHEGEVDPYWYQWWWNNYWGNY